MIDRRDVLLGGAAAGLAAAAGVRSALAATGDLAWDALYKGGDFSEQARLFNKTPVAIVGYMAPPLTADAKFFVLANVPMAICPFCSAAAEWPENIVVVYADGPIRVVDYQIPIRVSGKLELGEETDAETGFVSKVRVKGANYVRLPNTQVIRPGGPRNLGF
ncbi:MAG: hypothetical protein U1E56_10600 [Bauldia sp.]